MTCPYLEYRTEDPYPTPRGFCTVADRFVQPMRADMCNDRWQLDHEHHCEIYREQDGDEQ